MSDPSLTLRIRINREDAVNRLLEREINNSDLIYHVGKWPHIYLVMLRKVHKDRYDRFKLWRFLWYNGVPPEKARDWVMWHQRYELTRYDASAWRDMQENVKLAKKARAQLSEEDWKTLERWNKYPVFCLDDNKVHRKEDEELHNVIRLDWS